MSTMQSYQVIFFTIHTTIDTVEGFAA